MAQKTLKNTKKTMQWYEILAICCGALLLLILATAYFCFYIAFLIDYVSEESLLDPIRFIAYTADELEKKYIGGDQN